MTGKRRLLIITDEHPRFPGPAADAAQYLLIRELQDSGAWDVHLAVAIKSDQVDRLTAVARLCTLHTHIWDLGAAAANSIVYGPLRRVYHRMLRQPLLRSTAARIKSTYFSMSRIPARVRSAQYPGFRAFVSDLVTRISPDVVLVQHSYLADLGDALGGAPYAVCVYDLLTLHTRRASALAPSLAKKLALRIEAAKMLRFERDTLSRAGAVILMTENERQAYRQVIGADNAVVIPVGVDIEYFAPQPRSDEPLPEYRRARPRLLYTGSFTYGPNLDALDYFARDIAPRLAARFPDACGFFVGPWAPAAEHIRARYLARQDLVVTGKVADARPWFRDADVVIVPLRLGTGIRVKILEAMSMRLPVVTTSIGAEGIEATPGQHLLIADTPEQFVNAVAMLTANRAVADRMTEAARALVERRYSITAMVRSTADTLVRIMR